MELKPSFSNLLKCLAIFDTVNSIKIIMMMVIVIKIMMMVIVIEIMTMVNVVEIMMTVNVVVWCELDNELSQGSKLLTRNYY